MKPLKVVAVVAGSMVVAGAAGPACAAELMPSKPPTSLKSALDVIESAPLGAQPLQTNALDTENKDSALSAVKGATKRLNSPNGPTRFLGGLPLQK
ncbi:hypothetical protein G5C60_29800 [Streptomyces sp. HC44]|uniref:Secreted protein n=1 Tax=Streptomyces scabichelini TaxID=2711217 RepID=A0A6G4VCY7_9ACTN|nr:hypothetical protein [Streptomyces scabichelini]NGO11677.1 hypothetical protein [Streptomyces scabichelini]